MSRNLKRAKQPWWYMTKTEAQAFWMGALGRTGSCRLGRGGDGRQRSAREGHRRRVDANGCGIPNERSCQTSSVGSFGGRLLLTGDVVEFRFNV